MKKITLIILSGIATALSQTPVGPLKVNPNTGAVVDQANFWTGNAAGICSGINATVAPVWTNITSVPANVSALAGLTSAADKGIQFTGSGTAATFDLTTAGKALLDDADAAAQRATLGLEYVDNTSDANKPVSTATQTALDLKLDDSQASAFGLSLLDDADAGTARTTLGLGTLATQSGTFSGTSSGTNTGDQSAATVANTPAGAVAATDVQAAINELDTEKATSAQGALADTAVQPARTISTTAPLTGGGDLSANRTLAVSAATTSASGVSELATDAETQAGTDTDRTVPVSALAAWWTWVKTQAQTIAGAITLTGKFTAGDAAGDEFVANDDDPRFPNLTATSYTAAADNKVAINGDVADKLFLLGKPLMRGRGIWDISPGWGGTPTFVGSGVGVPSGSGFRLSTGSTANSSALWRPNSSSLIRFGKNSNSSGVQFSRPVWLIWAGQIDLRTTGVFRVQLGRLYSDTTIADFVAGASTNGLGFYLSGGDVKLETANNATRSLSSSLASYSTAGVVWIDLKARSDGAGNVRVWVNDTEVAAQTGGPVDGNNSSYNGLFVSVENGASAASYFTDNSPGQITIIVE